MMLGNVVEEFVKKFGKKDANGKEEENDEEEEHKQVRKESRVEESEGQNEMEDFGDESGLYYYSKEDGAYKIFDPANKKWSLSQTKPDENKLAELKKVMDELKQKEDEMAKRIHYDIAGETEQQVHDL